MDSESQSQLRPFRHVPDRDVVTLADRTVGPLEFYSLLTARELLIEIEERGLGDALIERRSYNLRLRNPQLTNDGARTLAKEQIERFSSENFPWLAADADEAEATAEADRWNAYIQF